MRIIFMGTPEFAVPSLDILVNAGHDIVAVITSPDRMGGRGRKTLLQSAVKKYAVRHNLKVLQPTNLKNKDFVEELESLQADLQIVVAFRMLPEVVWNMPQHGTYNLHGSLLPRYRGAAPINWAVINGDLETGVTSFKLKHAIDTGSILYQKKMPVLQNDNASDVHDRMMYLGAEVILRTVQAVINGNVQLMEQEESEVSHAPKLNKDNTQIDWNQNSKKVYDFIRGLSWYPGAWFDLNGADTKIFKAEHFMEDHTMLPGSVKTDNRSFLHIACKNGWINVLQLKYPGKRLMEVKAFLNGFDLNSTP